MKVGLRQNDCGINVTQPLLYVTLGFKNVGDLQKKCSLESFVGFFAFNRSIISCT